MLGRFGPRYGRSRAVSFRGDAVVKSVAPEVLAFEVRRTRLAHELGTRWGAFHVPRVIACDEQAGTFRMERIDGLLTLGQMLAGGCDEPVILGRAGAALACIHGGPAADDEQPVLLHGDFNTVNVCYQPQQDRLVVLDWPADRPMCHGAQAQSRYVDLGSFLYSLLAHQARSLEAIGRFGRRADAFIAGYENRLGRSVSRPRLRDVLLQTSRHQMRRARRGRGALRACVYTALAALHHLALVRLTQGWAMRRRFDRRLGAQRPAALPDGHAGGTDYRLSHQQPGRGRDYDRQFRKVPFRRHVWRCEQAALDSVLSKHLPARAVRHLDFACGTGRILAYLRGRVASSTGVDVSESMLQEARGKTDAEMLCADLTRQDVLGQRQFDLITAFRFFPNAQPSLRQQAMRCLAGHLADGGVLVFNNHRNASSTLHRLGALMGLRRATMSRREAQELAAEAGLRIDETYSIGVLPASDRAMVAPAVVHRLADRLAGAAGLGSALAQNVIFVCRKPPQGRTRP